MKRWLVTIALVISTALFAASSYIFAFHPGRSMHGTLVRLPDGYALSEMGDELFLTHFQKLTPGSPQELAFKRSMNFHSVTRPTTGVTPSFMSVTFKASRSIPEGLLVLLAALPTIALALWLPQIIRQSRRRPGHCPNCGYNLTGNQSGVCPECGSPAAAGRSGMLTDHGTGPAKSA